MSLYSQVLLHHSTINYKGSQMPGFKYIKTVQLDLE